MIIRRAYCFTALWLVALFPIWAVAAQNNNASSRSWNLPEQHQLCEKDLDVEILQKTYSLVRVDASPTHAAMHPAWPSVLTTLLINLGIFLWYRFTEHG